MWTWWPQLSPTVNMNVGVIFLWGRPQLINRFNRPDGVGPVPISSVQQVSSELTGTSCLVPVLKKEQSITSKDYRPSQRWWLPNGWNTLGDGPGTPSALVEPSQPSPLQSAKGGSGGHHPASLCLCSPGQAGWHCESHVLCKSQCVPWASPEAGRHSPGILDCWLPEWLVC